MTNLKYLQKFFFLLVMGISLSFICACGDDEEPVQEPEKEESLGIIGTWRGEFSTGFYYIYFDKAGYGWDNEYDEADGGWYDKELFTYVYDATNRVIVIKYEDETVKATVVALSETKLVLDFGQSTGLEFYERISDGEYKTGDEEIQKPEPEETPNLVGTWRYEFGNDYHFLYFDKFGYGWEKWYDDGKWGDKESFTYVYDNSTKNLTLEYTDGYITEMTVEYLSESVLVFDGFHENGFYFCDRMSNGEYIPNKKDQKYEMKKDLTGTWCYEYDDGSLDYWYFDGLGNGWHIGTWNENDKESFTYVYNVYDDSDKEYGDPYDEYNDSDGKIVIYYEDGYDITFEIDFHSDNAIQMIIDAPGFINSYYVRISNDEIKSLGNE